MNTLTVRRMISPDGPAQIVLSQISCQRAIKGRGQSDVERPRDQSEIRKTLQRLEQGRVGHALGGEPSAWNHDTSIGCAWHAHLPTLSARIVWYAVPPHRRPLRAELDHELRSLPIALPGIPTPALDDPKAMSEDDTRANASGA